LEFNKDKESCFSREENNCGEKEAINSNLCRNQKPDFSMHSSNGRYCDSYNEKSKSTAQKKLVM
jgi:hypothetical protein